MQKIKITKNPYLLFSPVLVMYIALVLIYKSDAVKWDADIYLQLAKNLTHGYFSPPAPIIDFGNGPGYPLLISPVIFLKLPLVTITILNAIFYYLSIVLVFKIIDKYVGFREAIIFSLFRVVYFHSLEHLPIIGYEIFVTFMISLILFFVSRVFDPDCESKKKANIILSGFFIGYLAITLATFAYVIVTMIVGVGLLLIFNRKSNNLRKGIVILVIAIFTTVPYQLYTYSLTGRVFYFGTYGGSNLYWMTSPFANEYGSWYKFVSLKIDGAHENMIPGGEEAIKRDHKKDFEEILKYRGVEQDDAYKRISMQNIKNHPMKFVRNCICNIGRILFNTPYSYHAQTDSSLKRLPFNGILVVLALFCAIPTCINWRKIPFSIRFMLLFILIFLGGSVFGSAEIRVSSYVVSIIVVWIAFIIKKWIVFKPRFD